MVRPNTVLVSCLPAIFFFIGIIFLAYSNLTISKVIEMQNRVFVILFQELSQNNLLAALFSSFQYLWVNALWIILIFSVVISSGFISYALFKSEVDFRLIGISQLLFLIIVYLLTNSLVMFLASLSMCLGILWMHKMFEEEKRDFSTGFSVVSSRIGLVNVFLSIGIFLMIFLNMSGYEQQIETSNMEMFSSFVPEMSGLKEVQKKQIEDITEGFKYSLKERYEFMSETDQTQCKTLYEGLTQGLDSYRDRSIQNIEEQQLNIGEEELMEYIPLFGLITKITPLLIGISAYALLSIINPFMGIFGGVFYSLVKRIKKK